MDKIEATSKIGSKRRVVQKTYRLNDLVLSERDLAHRCALITRHTLDYPPEVSFAFHKAHLVRTSKRLADARPISSPTAFEARRLAEQIDAAHAIGLVHGDIRPKNVLRTQDGCALIDWEPSLFQILNGRFAVMITPPAHHPEDVQARVITRVTDWYGFALLLFSLGSDEILRIIRQAQTEQPSGPAGWVADRFAAGAIGEED